ncbi:MAG: RNA polymerase sigma factor [Bacteroidales bacterium]|nr:RNA polymerase sigma factor [Bacteroidales bacterium]MDD4384257.1 RNA polymerase sigma factor [Bacteroidales bacterium]MDY0197413.1 RNA polymerase sigma factor [Tenuifilaceae bacterium]
MRRVKYLNNNQSLIDLCKKGDTNAQFEIYSLYSKAMYNTCLRIIGDTVEAEDVLQEAFFKAFDKINTYRNEVSFGAWLKRIVVNASLDQLKKSKVDLIPLDSIQEIKSESGEGDDFEPETVEELRWAIAQLPEGYRTIVSLFYFEGYSHDEISQILGVKASTSRSQLTRARQHLYELMKIKGKNIRHG